MEVKLAGLGEEKERSIKTGSHGPYKDSRVVGDTRMEYQRRGANLFRGKKRSLVLGNKDEIL